MPVQGEQRLNPVIAFVANGAAAAIARGAVNPWSVMKIRSQVGVTGSKMGLYPNAYWIYRLEGFRGFVKGIEVASAQAFVYTGLQFGVHHALMKKFGAERGDLRSQPSLNYLASTYITGAVGGVVATTVVHPMDVLKVRQTVARPGSPFHGSLLTGLPTLLREGLFRGLYRGFLPSVIGICIFLF